MRGEFLPVWAETWRDIWSKLGKYPGAPTDLFSELFRVQTRPPQPPTAPEPPSEVDDQGRMVREEDLQAYAGYRAALDLYRIDQARYEEAVGDSNRARTACRAALIETVRTEVDAIATLERGFAAIDGFDVDTLRNYYFKLVEKFIEKFSLSYDLRRPFTLHTTPSGLYTRILFGNCCVLSAGRNAERIASRLSRSLSRLKIWRLIRANQHVLTKAS